MDHAVIAVGLDRQLRLARVYKVLHSGFAVNKPWGQQTLIQRMLHLGFNGARRMRGTVLVTCCLSRSPPPFTHNPPIHMV